MRNWSAAEPATGGAAAALRRGRPLVPEVELAVTRPLAFGLA
ncbi:hypothetical protein [Nonomuraea africana]